MEWSPEHSLWKAVLEEAMNVVGKGRRDIIKHGKVKATGQAMNHNAYLEAVAWFARQDAGCGTFEWVAGMLRMDSSAIRNKIAGGRIRERYRRTKS